MSPAVTESPTAFHPLVRAALGRAGLPTDEPGPDLLARFLQTLLDANRRFNLTRITAPAEAVQRHIVEPLAGWARIAPDLPPGPLLDVGSGGGAPGIPLAIAAPQRPVTLLEARGRKAAFLRTAAAALPLPNVTVAEARAETFAHGPARESFALATTRALAPLPIALELLLPFVTPGGLALIYAGPALPRQLAAVAALTEELGGEPLTALPLRWPGAERALFLGLVRKRRPTPARYPRRPSRLRRPRGP